MSTPSEQPRARFVGVVCDPEAPTDASHAWVRDPYRAVAPVPLVTAERFPVGTVLGVRVRPDGGAEPEGPPLAKAGTARAELYQLTWEHGCDPAFSDAIEREVEALLANPGLDDPALEDLTHLPFVTVDGPYARDLDQALYVTRCEEPAGFEVHYALADASYYAPAGSALFGEALRRGATFYLPGLAVPMLPRPLSEHLVSLNPDGPRRSLVVRVRVDANGEVLSAGFLRAKIHSRAKLSFLDVQQLVDAPEHSPLANRDFTQSLFAFREVGRVRMQLAAMRGVVRYQREEVELSLDGDDGAEFEVLTGARHESELWNEQLSLLCNREGANLLRESPAPHVQPIYRVHPSPDPERLVRFAEHLVAFARVHELDPAQWTWDPQGEKPLAEFIVQLPQEGRQAHLTRAVQRQAILVNMRSGYSTEPAPHHGVGAEAYARFSAPMRELVGVWVHKEALEMLAGSSPIPNERDEETRQRVLESANRARNTQRKLADLAHRVALDRIFTREIELALEARPVRRAAVLGLTNAKVHVQFEAPPLDVKLYLRDLERAWGERTSLDEQAVCLRAKSDGRLLLREGDSLNIRLDGFDETSERWVLTPV